LKRAFLLTPAFAASSILAVLLCQGNVYAVSMATPIKVSTIESSEYLPLKEGALALAQHNYALALHELRKALWINPTNLLALFDMGCSYLEMAKSTKEKAQRDRLLVLSTESFERVTDLSEDFILPYFKLGKIALIQGDNDAAIRAYSRGLEIEPENATMTFNLARVYDQLNDRDKAIKGYRRTIELNPKFSYAYNNLALIYEDLKKPEEAEKQYAQALIQDPHYNLARLNYINLTINQGKYNQARQLLKVAQSQEKDNSWVYYYWGSLEMHLGHYANAVAAYNQSVQLDGENSQAYYFMALAYSRLNSSDEALQASLHYLQIEPNGTHSEEMKRLASASHLSHVSTLQKTEADQEKIK